MDDLVIWQPFMCLENPDKKNIVLIKLNRPFVGDEKMFTILWKKACLKAVVDGGINELYNCPDLVTDQFIPDFISGDFDSAKPEVLEYYRKKDVELIPTPDQNETDFTKALRIVCDKLNRTQVQVACICTHVSFDGRFDHVLANINTLYEAYTMTDLPLYLICGQLVSFLIQKGRCLVQTGSQQRDRWCCLVPIGEPCHCVTTTGLKYNLDHQCLQFGKLISSSNFCVDETVTVETDNFLLMIIGFKDD
ncbi:hypothetical protein LSH36_33g04044 [Paralvinella palmiformis]|uniref:Thiamin pyrophosphokinase thiamin-binding domain-containing protein n=1 Tax=Paralvinella palmiformis TaxID=53620 RepID=A0AAD9NFR3_9ANNE|nr:hypothetical protein LSH36_33g04044 [Paralvinella palmiformis]